MIGRFITLEGSEGAGKSTNLDTVCQTLERHNIKVYRTREPGGTPVAEALREIVLGQWHEEISGLSELLMVFAARNQHLESVIRPQLQSGAWVVCDRFTDATYAYQGYGRGLDLEQIARLEAWVHGDLQPDLTVYLDVPSELSAARIAHRSKDRMEQEGAAFFDAVRRGYLARAEELSRFVTIDASKSLDEVQQRVGDCVEAFVASLP